MSFSAFQVGKMSESFKRAKIVLEVLEMNISPGEEIAGFPAIRLRELFRRIGDGQMDKKGAAYHLGTTQKRALEILLQLEKEGFLKSITIVHNKKTKIWWELATKGVGLKLASAARPIKRATADRLLKELLERVEIVNDSPEYLYWVVEVIVFGSYLDPKRLTMSDIDIAVGLEAKEKDRKKHVALCRYQVEAEVSGYLNLFDELYYSFYKTLKRLKNRSWGISIHTTDDPILKTGIPTKKVYPPEKAD